MTYKKIAAVLALLIVVLGGVWLCLWWQSPADGKVMLSPVSDGGVLGSESELVSLRTVYSKTRYPSTLRVLTSNDVARGSIAGQYVLGLASLKHTDQLAITVGRLDSMALTELPAVKLRRLQTDVYALTTKKYAPLGALIYAKIDGSETSVFWADGARYAEVVVSGSPARFDMLEADLEAVITNWRWE